MNAIFAGTAGAGGLIGLLIALSATPVVATFLPLLLSLFGGAGGFFAFKIDFTKANTKKQLILFGWSLTSFSVAAMVGVFVGIATKHLFYTQQLSEKVEVRDVANQADLVRKLTMRRRLEGLGASRSEIEKFFVYRYDAAVATEKLAALNAAITSIISIYEKSERQSPTSPIVTNPFVLFSQLVNSCRRVRAVIAAVDRQIQNKEIPIEIVELIVADLRSIDFAALIRTRAGAADENSTAEMTKSVTALYAGLLEIRAILPLQNSDKEIQEADKVWITGQPSPQMLQLPRFDPVANSGLLQMWN